MRKRYLLYVIPVAFILLAGACMFRTPASRFVARALGMVESRRTITQRLEQYGEAVHTRLAGDFARIGVKYPPADIILVALKQERLLEVWVSADKTGYRLLKRYPVLGASGTLGPKLREGDKQVPEGIYRIESLNPNSAYHLALRVNYPNTFDRNKGTVDGRINLGGDIMIHGKSCSIGCLAMGDEAAEDLFVLAAEVGIENISVIISPVDFRVRDLPGEMPPLPLWADELYAAIRQELQSFSGDLGPAP